jgi:probable HAF family extracellular repeat protein
MRTETPEEHTAKDRGIGAAARRAVARRRGRRQALLASVALAIAGWLALPEGARAATFFGLGTPTLDGTTTFAQAVSADGAVVVGNTQTQAFRWTETGGMISLGSPPGGPRRAER